MNTGVKMVAGVRWPGVWGSSPLFLWGGMSATQLRRTVLYLAVLFSSVGVIYTQDVHRRLLTHQSWAVATEQHLQREWDKLLLERGAWSNPARVQVLAQHKWGMHTVRGSEVEYLTDVMS